GGGHEFRGNSPLFSRMGLIAPETEDVERYVVAFAHRFAFVVEATAQNEFGAGGNFGDGFKQAGELFQERLVLLERKTDHRVREQQVDIRPELPRNIEDVFVRVEFGGRPGSALRVLEHGSWR